VVAAFEGTVVTSAMPTIARSLGGMAAYSWVFSAYLMASTLGVLLCGRLADSFGRKPVFIWGVVLFLIGSALCGVSTTIGQLVAFRVVQGLGAGAIQPIAMTISADLYTLAERANVQAVFTSAWGIANVVGPIIGGFIVLHTTWRWVFLVNLPPGLLAIALLVPSYQDPPRAPAREGADGGSRLRAAIGSLTALLASNVVRAGLVASVFSGATLYLCTAYVPLWMTTHAHLDALRAGAALVPLLTGWAFGSSFGVRVLVRHGMRASVAGGYAIAFAGASLLAVIGARDLPIAWAYVALALLGVGLGPASSTSLVAPQSAVLWRQRGLVTSAIYAMRLLGGSLAVVAFGGGAMTGAGRLQGVAVVTLLAAIFAWVLAPPDAGALGEGVESTA
jgi:predicted MFS family arabinose efflux permease